MTRIIETVFLILVPLLPLSSGLFEGDPCLMLQYNGPGDGTCVDINKCEYAKQLLQMKKTQPQNCGFKGQTPLVCCPKSTRNENVYRSDENCQKYHHVRKRESTIVSGEEASGGEFPHMAVLGYGKNKANVQWLCGGTLISDRFVLTAAHCTAHLDLGAPKWVRLGELNLQQTDDDAEVQDIDISNIFVHPEYKPPSHYNDIALLKLKNSAKFGTYVQPACIHTAGNSPVRKLQATGWGKTAFLGDTSPHLMKVFLYVIQHKKCAEMYSTISSRKLAKGILDTFQMCAGDYTGKDTCAGDSGGPLHFLQNRVSNFGHHYVVVGVTSFGKGCGAENSAGVYTRVSAYRSWIEDIVWPIK